MYSSSKHSDHLYDIEYLFNKYYARLCYFTFKLIKNQDDSKDLVQDVFLKCWQKKETFESELAIKNFLYLSLKNASLNYIRHLTVEKKFVDDLSPEKFIEEKTISNLIRAEVLATIHLAIENLPDGCKLVLKLAFNEGLKNDQIAQQLGISVNTVKTQKQRALKLLRLSLSDTSYLLLLFILRS